MAAGGFFLCAIKDPDLSEAIALVREFLTILLYHPYVVLRGEP
jgi:hypothetical protein